MNRGNDSPSSRMVWERAVAYYKGSGRSVSNDFKLMKASEGSFVCRNSRLIALLRPVPRGADPHVIVDPACVFPVALCDTWHVHFLAGDLSYALRLAYELAPLEWFCYQRGQRSSRLIFRHRNQILKPKTIKNNIMGFMKPKMPSLPVAPAPVEEIPVIKTETIEINAEKDVAQQQKRRKGVLSMILADRSPSLEASSKPAEGVPTYKMKLG